jgi:hypothetical protein
LILPWFSRHPRPIRTHGGVLHEAVTHAVTLQQKHNKVPWIKTGEQVLTPEEITELYMSMGDVSGLGSGNV